MKHNIKKETNRIGQARLNFLLKFGIKSEPNPLGLAINNKHKNKHK